MKLIIAGGRDHILTEDEYSLLDELLGDFGITEVVSGKARGVDTCGEIWAELNNIKVEPFLAEWAKYGKSAGNLRNTQMALYGDALAIFSGGSGSADMLKQAKQKDLVIFDFREPEESFEDVFGINS